MSVRMVRDLTGRFAKRPHYDPVDLDREAESIVSEFLLGKYEHVRYPIDTEDLWLLLDRDTSSVDRYADLTEEGEDVEGLTEFFRTKRPQVRISAELTSESRMVNRLRTTITHEYGHVKFHGFLWQMEAPSLPLFGTASETAGPRCRRESIVGASTVDWMEWQAGYLSGALLMPVGAMRRLVDKALPRGVGVLQHRDPRLPGLVEAVQQQFMVSADAARVRLVKLGYLTPQAEAVPLGALEA